jgi:vancomycin resistance protein VanW
MAPKYTMQSPHVAQPQKRSKLRKWLGKTYFIAKRKLDWWKHAHSFAKTSSTTPLPYSVFEHQSLLLRPLKEVDMYLQHNKITNLKLAIQPINHVIIAPGEIFSIWKLVGKPTSKKGYLEGLTLENGKISKGVGGGLCQLGNLLYWMALHSPLEIKERWRHGYDVFPDVNRTIPFACGATLSYNYIDLQLQNNTSQNFQIKLWIDDTHLHGELKTDMPIKHHYTIFETDHLFKQQWWGGYTRHNKIWKKIIDLDNNTIEEELVASNSAIMMYNPMLEM